LMLVVLVLAMMALMVLVALVVLVVIVHWSHPRNDSRPDPDRTTPRAAHCWRRSIWIA